MQEDGREEEYTDTIHPKENSVPLVQLSGKRKSIGEKPEHAQEIEVSGRRHATATDVDDRAYRERENPYRGEEVVDGNVSLG